MLKLFYNRIGIQNPIVPFFEYMTDQILKINLIVHIQSQYLKLDSPAWIWFIHGKIFFPWIIHGGTITNQIYILYKTYPM